MTSTFTCTGVPAYCFYITRTSIKPLTPGHKLFLASFSAAWAFVGGTNVWNERVFLEKKVKDRENFFTEEYWN